MTRHTESPLKSSEELAEDEDVEEEEEELELLSLLSSKSGGRRSKSPELVTQRP